MSHSLIPNDSTRPYPLPSPDAELECSICRNVRKFAAFDQSNGKATCASCQDTLMTIHRKR